MLVMTEYTSSILGSNTLSYDLQIITYYSETLIGAIRTLVADGSGYYYIGFIVIGSTNAIDMYLISYTQELTCLELRAASSTSATLLY